jgi:uncharacterized protein with HEPN domain
MPSKPVKPVDTALRDILHHIELAANFTAGFNRASFKQDIKTVYAVTRCMEIISEASRHLADDVKARHPSIGGNKWLAQETSIGMITKTLRLSWCGRRWSGHCRPYGP